MPGKETMKQQGRVLQPDPLWKVLGIAIWIAFSMWAPLLAVPPIEHILIKTMNLTHTQVSWLYGGPILMMSLLAIPGGFLADSIGVKRTAGIGCTIIVIGNLLKGTAADYGQLLAYTLIYGVGLGLSFPNLPKLVAHCTPHERAHATMSIFTAGVLVSGGLSLAITLPVVYPIMQSYQGVFLIWSVPAFTATILWWFFIKEPPCGADPLTAGSDLRMVGKVLKKKVLWLLSAVFVLHNFFLYSWAGWITLFLVTKSASPGLAALIGSITLWMGIPSVLLATIASTKLGRRKPLLWAPGILMAVAALLAPYVDLRNSWLLMALVGACTTTRFTTILSLPIEIMPKEETGTASGLVMSVGYLGALLGPLICGRILDATNSFHLVFLVLTGVSALTSVLALALPETGGNQAPTETAIAQAPQ